MEVVKRVFTAHRQWMKCCSTYDVIFRKWNWIIFNPIPQETDGIIINAGGLSHTSIALADAVAAVKITVVEVHISNIAAREAYRHHSYITAHCQGIIAGLGLAGYLLAVRYLVDQKNMQG